MRRREEVVHRSFQIEAWCCGAKYHSARIDFYARLKLLNHFGGAAYTNKKQPRRQRVEGASMTYFDFFDFKSTADVPFDFVDDLKRSPAHRFVYGNYCARFVSHGVK